MLGRRLLPALLLLLPLAMQADERSVPGAAAEPTPLVARTAPLPAPETTLPAPETTLPAPETTLIAPALRQPVPQFEELSGATVGDALTRESLQGHVTLLNIWYEY